MTNRRDWTEQEKLRLKVSQRTIEGRSWGWDELTPEEQAQLANESRNHLKKEGFLSEPSEDNLLTKAVKFLIGG
jgi:hypothetical protein